MFLPLQQLRSARTLAALVSLFYSLSIGAAESLTAINDTLSISESGLIVLQIDESLSNSANLFDLENQTLRFTPTNTGYSVETLSSQLETTFGSSTTTDNHSLSNFQFSFAGAMWSDVYINEFGTLSFGAADVRNYFADMRFQGLESLVSSFPQTTPTLSVLFAPRLSGARYFRELNDRVIVTWEVSEACCGIFEFIMEENTNIFQAVLHGDGRIDFNYGRLDTAEGIVGVFGNTGILTVGAQLAAISDPINNEIQRHLDVINVSASELSGQGISVELTLREGFSFSNLPSNLSPLYRVHIDTDAPLISGIDFDDADYVWTVSVDNNQFVTSGAGVFSQALVNDGKILIQGKIPNGMMGDDVAIFVDTVDFSTNPLEFDQIDAIRFQLPATSQQEFDFSDSSPFESGDSFHEVFHYKSVPSSRDISCQILPQIGDNYDFLVSYSQFRMDKPEASTPVQPLESGVEGIGFSRTSDLSRYCSDNRLKSAHEFPIFMDANMATAAGPNGSNDGYDYAMSLLGHEFGHTWGIDIQVILNGEMFTLNDSSQHWIKGLHAPAAHPWTSSPGASTMGGSYWQDNLDGTFTELASNFFSPATGYSYLDLYLMGIIPAEEVPDFFVVQNFSVISTDSEGRLVYSGDRVDISIDDIVSNNGIRSPSSADSQKDYKAAFVYLHEAGAPLDTVKFNRLGEIRTQFSNYYSFITGGMGSMTTSDMPITSSTGATFSIATNTLSVPSLRVGEDSYSLTFRLLSSDPADFELADFQLLTEEPSMYSSEFVDGVLSIPNLAVAGQNFSIELSILSENPPIFRLTSAVEL